MKTTLLLRCFSLVLISSFLSIDLDAQIRNDSRYVNWSAEFKSTTWMSNKVNTSSELLSDGSILIYRTWGISRPTEINYALFDPEMKLVKEGVKTLKIADEYINVAKILFYQDQLLLLSWENEEAKKVSNFRILQYDPVSTEIVDNNIVLGTIPYYSSEKTPNVRMSLSENEEQLLVCGQFQEKMLIRQSEMKAWVLDAQLKLQWSREIKLPFSKTTASFNFWINNDGEVFGHAYRSDDENWSQSIAEQDKYSYVLSRFTQTEPFEYTEIPKTSIGKKGFRSFPTKEGELMYAGLFKEKDSKYVTGIHYQTFDPNTLKPSEKQVSVFNDALSKDEKGRPYHWLRHNRFVYSDLVELRDGSKVIIAQKLVSSETNGGIIVSFIDDNGDFQWNNYVYHRSEKETQLGWYTVANTADEICLIMGDDDRNYKEVTGYSRKTYDGGNACIILVRMNKDGKVRTSFLSNQKDKRKERLIPHMTTQLSDGTVLLFDFQGKYSRIGRLNLEELPAF